MLYEDLFGPWGLLIIIVIGVGIILIALLLFACFLTPGCIGYECFRKQSTISENVDSHRDSFNSVNAQCENMEYSSTLNLIQIDKQKSDKKVKEFPIELTMSLQYLPPCDDIITGKLVIGIE
ncbi:nuclear factor-like kappa-b-binding protein, partial [Lasius niger]